MYKKRGTIQAIVPLFSAFYPLQFMEEGSMIAGFEKEYLL